MKIENIQTRSQRILSIIVNGILRVFPVSYGTNIFGKPLIDRLNNAGLLYEGWYIDDRWIVYAHDGCVYDMLTDKDIPQRIFEVRDTLMGW